MKQRIDTKRLCSAALLLAAGILLPQVFHSIGGPAAGGVFLPMHIPVLVAGLLLGPFYGAVIAVVTPVVSFLCMGMPPAAKLPFMVLELVGYGAVSGLLYSRKWNLYLSLVVAQMSGRAVYALSLLMGAYILRLPVPQVAVVGTAIVTGLPGIVIQLVFVPAVVILVRRVIRFDARDGIDKADSV
jgi:riboflavin transporter FmnP